MPTVVELKFVPVGELGTLVLVRHRLALDDSPGTEPTQKVEACRVDRAYHTQCVDVAYGDACGKGLQKVRVVGRVRLDAGVVGVRGYRNAVCRINGGTRPHEPVAVLVVWMRLPAPARPPQLVPAPHAAGVGLRRAVAGVVGGVLAKPDLDGPDWVGDKRNRQDGQGVVVAALHGAAVPASTVRMLCSNLTPTRMPTGNSAGQECSDERQHQ